VWLSLTSRAQKTAERGLQYASNTDYRSIPTHADITDEKSAQQLLDFTIKEFGRIGYCVNSAGVSH
jgi:NAD(P)-dependent dehydrogenase (short-subunit alcohol dehydrogenase family)